MTRDDDEVLIDRIYEAAVRPDLWPDWLASASRRLDLFGGLLIVDAPKAIRWSADARMQPVMQAFVDGGWHKNNTRMAGRLRCRKSGFVDEFDLYSKERLASEPMYVRHFRPLKLGWSASTLIAGPKHENIVVDFEQTGAAGPVGPATKAYLDGLRPHLARALAISTQLADRANARSTELLQALDLPALVVDEDGCVLAANDAAARLDEVVVGARGRLIFTEEATQEAFLLGVKRARRAYVVPRSPPAAPRRRRGSYVAQILPLVRSAADVFSRAAALVYFTQAGQQAPPAARLLTALFDFSPSEAEVAQGLLAGKDARGIAAARGVSVETVRMQIKSVLAKAGVRRQLELANLVANLVLPGASRN